MDTKQNMEYKMVSEFILKTGASPDDALACLKTWGWDMKRAFTDYNDTCAIDLIDEDNDNSKESVAALRSNFNQQQPQEDYKSTPVLVKQNSIDMTDNKKLFRGISRATDNVGIVSRARHEIAKDFYKSLKRNRNTNDYQYLVDTPDSTFILPNIYNYPDDFRIFIEKDLIEMSTLNALKQAQRLNWWVESNACRKLWPLATTGDGNCLLHAASLGIWGFHDRKLILRTALYSVLSDGKFKDALRRRWRFQQTQLNKRAGFVYSESEWSKEWDDIIAMASPEPRKPIDHHHHTNNVTLTSPPLTTTNNLQMKDDFKRKISITDRNSSLTENEFGFDNNSTSSSLTTNNAIYESLEEIHILALAHVLRRTIIVISDTVLRDLHGEAMSPITFGGIYLPFEIEPKECNRGPLLLAYDMAHFSALVPMENGSDYPPSLVPLTDYENVLLPIQFCIDPGEDFNWKSYNGNEDNWALTEREHIALLKEYLDVVYVATNRSPDDDEIYEDLDDDFEKKFIESEIVIPTTIYDYNMTNDETTNNNNTNGNANNNNNFINGKSKASRQLHSVAKQFGSIGKNMSRKLKKNIGSIAKLGGKNVQKKNSFIIDGGASSSTSQPSCICSRILCAKLRLKRHEYQEEMIRNYLECAQNRFIEIEKAKEQKFSLTSPISTGTTQSVSSNALTTTTATTITPTNTGIMSKDNINCISSDSNGSSSNRIKLESLNITDSDNSNLMLQSLNNHSYCINSGCNQYATSDTSYLCLECFEKQKKHENSQYFNSSPRYGTGNSKFYTQADIQSHESIRKLPSLKKLNELDQTLYLSNSTFYNDLLPIYNEIEQSNKESQKYLNSTSSHQPLLSLSSSSSGSYNGNKIFISDNDETSSPIKMIDTNDHSNLYHDQYQHNNHNNHHQLIVNDVSSPASISIITKPCRTLDCPFYGNSSTNFLCSKCSKIKPKTQDYHHHHDNHNNSTFQSNPLYTGSTTTSKAKNVSTLYKNDTKITSDI